MTKAALTRWYALRPHAEQRALWDSSARFRVAPCGRRSGKSELAKRQGVRRAIQPSPYPDYRVLFGGPTYQQAKRVFWADVKKLVPRWALLGQDPRKAISEGELTIRLQNGGEIVVTGLDAPQRVEGSPLDFVVVDESADVKESAWLEHIRPGLSERGGEAWLVGTPEGRNWFWRLCQKAQENDGDVWSFHTWPSATVLPAEEIEIARAELDSRTFSQEYEASFLDVTGRVYYGFDRDVHAAEKLTYDPKLPLCIGLDFNIAPGVATFSQEQNYQGDNPRVASSFTAVVDELWIERDSNTRRICEEIVKRYRDHQSDVCIYADATGGAGGTAKVSGSDLDLIQKYLGPVFGPKTRKIDVWTEKLPGRLKMKTSRSNPPVRSRINAVNSRLESADSKVHLLVDPRCKHVVQDLEGVIWAGGGDLNKTSSPMLTHISDALGYYVAEKFPIRHVVSSLTQLT